MSVKLLTEHNLEFLSLKGGYTGSSKSKLVKMPHCWQSHVTTHWRVLGLYEETNFNFSRQNNTPVGLPLFELD